MAFADFNSEDLRLSASFFKEVLKVEVQLKSICFCMTADEVEGEIIDTLTRHLHEINCPRVLVSPLINLVKTRFLAKDIKSFLLENVQNSDGAEYDVAAVTKELCECLKEVYHELSTDLSSLKLQKNSQMCYVSLQSVKNKRRKMEDRHIFHEDLNSLFNFHEASCGQSVFAVFDGHGGTDAANYAASQFVCKLKSKEYLLSNPGDALHDAIIDTDAGFISKAKRERLKSGATAVVVLLQNKNLTVAWLGDSQVVLCKDGNAVQLMEPHKPDRQDERERIEALGGCVVFFGGWRVNGTLSVSRAIGDYEQKPFIASEPDIEEFEMEGDEEFIILACDGLWDTVEPFDAVEKVKDCIKNGTRDSAAEELVELAKANRSMDNITVMVVYLDFYNKKIESESNTSEQDHAEVDSNLRSSPISDETEEQNVPPAGKAEPESTTELSS